MPPCLLGRERQTAREREGEREISNLFVSHSCYAVDSTLGERERFQQLLRHLGTSDANMEVRVGTGTDQSS